MSYNFPIFLSKTQKKRVTVTLSILFHAIVILLNIDFSSKKKEASLSGAIPIQLGEIIREIPTKKIHKNQEEAPSTSKVPSLSSKKIKKKKIKKKQVKRKTTKSYPKKRIVRVKKRHVTKIQDLDRPEVRETYLARFKKPVYPILAYQRDWEGQVKVRLKVDKKGNVAAIKVLESSGYKTLDNSVLETVKTWKFKNINQSEFIYFEKKVAFVIDR